MTFIRRIIGMSKLVEGLTKRSRSGELICCSSAASRIHSYAHMSHLAVGILTILGCWPHFAFCVFGLMLPSSCLPHTAFRIVLLCCLGLFCLLLPVSFRRHVGYGPHVVFGLLGPVASGSVALLAFELLPCGLRPHAALHHGDSA